MKAQLRCVDVPGPATPGSYDDAAHLLVGALGSPYAGTAVAARRTADLWRVMDAMDGVRQPYRGHGSALFIAHPILRQWLLACVALADRDDATAEAALYSSPFFALDPEDLVVGLQTRNAAHDIRRTRLVEAREVVAELRQRRHRIPPFATARALLERSPFMGTLERLPNGAQDLAAARDLLKHIEVMAWEENIDFDVWASRVRELTVSSLVATWPAESPAGVVQILSPDLEGAGEFEHVLLWPPCFDTQEADSWRLEQSPDGTLEITLSAHAKLCVREQVTVLAPPEIGSYIEKWTEAPCL